ncbi:glyoxalase [Microbacterium pumilum]|uniref:Glyoxalase n=1 Tax=Microbacterium pumilum TaxID=344165 RepID=A0ABN2S4Q4_9MICO
MATIDFVTIGVADTTAAEQFYAAAFGLGDRVRVAPGDEPATGFRGFTLSLVVSQPSTVDGFLSIALAAGATSLKPGAKSLWGYGGVVQAPDGAVWTIASSSKKDTGPATREIDEFVLQLGVEDVDESKQFYVDHGVPVAKAYGRKYVQLGDPSSPVTLALYQRRGLAKVAGLPAEGTGSHRIVMTGDAGGFTDPDGFEWATEA